MSKRDDEIIAKYLTGEEAEEMSEIAEALDGIVKVENDCFIMGDGTPVPIKSMTTFERWAEEDKVRPENWLIIGD